MGGSNPLTETYRIKLSENKNSLEFDSQSGVFMNVSIRTHQIESRIDCFASWNEGRGMSGLVRGRLCELEIRRIFGSHGSFSVCYIRTYNDFYYHGNMKQFMENYYNS